MTQQFFERLVRERIIDTKRYRYIITEEHDSDDQWMEIKRLPITDLDTTRAIDGWETIKRIK